MPNKSPFILIFMYTLELQKFSRCVTLYCHVGWCLWKFGILWYLEYPLRTFPVLVAITISHPSCVLRFLCLASSTLFSPQLCLMQIVSAPSAPTLSTWSPEYSRLWCPSSAKNRFPCYMAKFLTWWWKCCSFLWESIYIDFFYAFHLVDQPR